MDNFLKVDAVIEEHNSNPDATFQLEHNELSDLVSWIYMFFLQLASCVTNILQ